MCKVMTLSRGDTWPLPSWSLLSVAASVLCLEESPPRELLRELGRSPLASQASPSPCYPGTAGWSVTFLSHPWASPSWSQVSGPCLALSPSQQPRRSACSLPLPPGLATEVDLRLAFLPGNTIGDQRLRQAPATSSKSPSLPSGHM